jgi:hypothetical protein
MLSYELVVGRKLKLNQLPLSLAVNTCRVQMSHTVLSALFVDLGQGYQPIPQFLLVTLQQAAERTPYSFVGQPVVYSGDGKFVPVHN